jgi:WD40 repeat protein
LNPQEVVNLVNKQLSEQGRRLNDLEVAMLIGSFEGLSYEEIAFKGKYKANYLKGDAGPKLWKLLSIVFNENVSKRNLLEIVHKKFPLTSVIHDKQGLPIATGDPMSCDIFSTVEDWEDAPEVSEFYGRESELSDMTDWIKKTKVIMILGMGGMGKTTLALKLAYVNKSKFRYVIWRSLFSGLSVFKLVPDLIRIISKERISESFEEQMLQLLRLMKSHPCLIILDNIETILDGKGSAGDYRSGYEGYSQLFTRIATYPHDSCLILTSREKPKNLEKLELTGGMVHSFKIQPLKYMEIKKIFNRIGKFRDLDDESGKKLTAYYGGNPLALELAAHHILEVFNGEISSFLNDEKVFSDIADTLDWHFSRISKEEKEVLYWLAINRRQTSIEELKNDLLSPISKCDLSSTLQSLQKRFMLQKNEVKYSLQPVLLEHVTNFLIEEICSEIKIMSLDIENTNACNNYALLKSQAQDYIRDAQRSQILKPIVARLILEFGSQRKLKEHLRSIITETRDNTPLKIGYLAGNIINLLVTISTDLTGLDFSDEPWDFSKLVIDQADFREAIMHSTDLSSSRIVRSAFAQSFGRVLSVVFHPEGELFASGDIDGNISLWRLVDFQQEWSKSVNSVLFQSMAFSKTGDFLVRVGEDQVIRAWDTNYGETLEPLEVGISIWSVDFTDGHTFACGCDDGKIRFFRINENKQIEKLGIIIGDDNSQRIRAVAFGSNSNLIASACDDNKIYVWNWKQNKKLLTLEGHDSWVSCLCFSSDNKYILSGSNDKTVILWKVNFSSDPCEGSLDQRFTNHLECLRSVAFSPDGESFASCSDDYSIGVWDLPERKSKVLKGHTNEVKSISFRSDSQELISGSYDQSIKLWELSSFHPIATIKGYTNWVRSVAFHPESPIIFCGCEDSIIRVWDFANGKLLADLQGHKSSIWSVACNPNGKIIASSSNDHTIKIWDCQSYECLKTLSRHTDWIGSIAFSPDGQILASGSDDKTVRIWNIKNMEQIYCLEKHEDWVCGVVFHPTKVGILASCSEDKTIKIWDVNEGKGVCLRTLEGHELGVRTIAFNHDGSLLATGSKDKTIRIWELKNFTDEPQSYSLLRHDGWVRSISFVEDERGYEYLVSSGTDRELFWWDIKTKGIVESKSKQYFNREEELALISYRSKSKNLAITNDHCVEILNLDGIREVKLSANRQYEGMKIPQSLPDPLKGSLKKLGAIIELEYQQEFSKSASTFGNHDTPAAPLPYTERIKISELRVQKNLTQECLSKKIGISTITLSNWEAGRRGLEMIKNFAQIHNVLECSIDELFPKHDVPYIFNLKKLREEKKLTQAALAIQVGVSENTILNWETGKGLSGFSLLAKLCTELACEPKALIL